VEGEEASVIVSGWVGPFMIHFQAHSSPENFLELDDIALESDDIELRAGTRRK
jgi:hypothetical protein